MASICSEPASKWTPIWLREGSQCPHSRSRRRIFRRTHPQYLARLPEMPVRVELMHRGMPSTEMGERPGGPFRPRQPDAGEGVALRVFGRKAGCGSYPKGRRSIVPNVHGPRLARRLPAEQGLQNTCCLPRGMRNRTGPPVVPLRRGQLSIRNRPTYRWVASRVVRPQGRLSGSYPKGRGSIVPDAWGAPAGRSGQGLKVRRTCWPLNGFVLRTRKTGTLRGRISHPSPTHFRV